ncbi:hypothetical protein [Demequina sediminicola]|uniref:hypothetical protein n=1 Tax=Demequina sediminicola TaxID=1095026 RepID=UPI00078274DC|nr:hypothetical protein [Demequina sediminicola]
MILELTIVAVFFLAGAVVSYASGLRGATQAVGALVVASTLAPALGWLLIVLHLPVNLWVFGALGGAAVALALVWTTRRAAPGASNGHQRGAGIAWGWLAGAAALSLIAAFTVRALLLFKWSTDSLTYINIGATLANDTYPDTIYPALLEDRVVGTPLLHEASALQQEFFLHAATPLTAGAIAAVCTWGLWRVVGRALATRAGIATAVVAVIALLVTNRLVFTSFYINGHATVALGVAVLAVGAWVLAERSTHTGWAVVMVIAGIATVVTRPDSIVLLAIVLLPIVTQREIPRAVRIWVPASIGVAAIAWQSYMVWIWHSYATSMSKAALISLAAAVGILVLAALAATPWITRWQVWILAAGEWGLWALLAAAALLTTGLVKASGEATWENTVGNAGGWFPMLPALGILIAAAFVLLRRTTTRPMRFVVTAFVPLMMLLAVARGAAYRVGTGDSLNRAWTHIVPVAIVLLIALLALGSQRLIRASRLNTVASGS